MFLQHLHVWLVVYEQKGNEIKEITFALINAYACTYVCVYENVYQRHSKLCMYIKAEKSPTHVI